MIKAILFDFGQTLVNSADGFRKAEKDAQTLIFEDLGFESWPTFLSGYRKLRQDFHTRSNFSRKELWKAVYAHYDRKADEGRLLRAEQDYWETVKALTVPFPETEAVLEQLATGHRLGLVTNTQGQRSPGQHRLSLFPEIEKNFETIIVAGEDGIPPKPAPEPFRLCLEGLGIPPSEAIYVGDDWRIDIRGAKDVGIQPIWLQHHSVSRKWPAVETKDPIIASLDQLTEWLNSPGKQTE